MMVKLEMISGPFQATFSPSSRGTPSQTVCAERIIISCSTEIYIDVTRTTDTSLDVMLT